MSVISPVGIPFDRSILYILRVFEAVKATQSTSYPMLIEDSARGTEERE